MADSVFLSAGHGGNDPGAVGNGLKEKDINLQTLLGCKAELERHNVKVFSSRTTDENDGVYEEVREAIASGVDLAVSFHTNAGGGNGFEAYCNTANPDGVRFSKLAEKYIKALGQNSRGVKDGTHLYFIRETPMTAVLLECFFIDNAADKNIGDTRAEQRALGVAYAKAILEYMGIDYKGNIPAKPAPSEPSKKLYRVQAGAYADYANAEKMRDKVIAAGFAAFISEE
ncbi:MAG: N-acetylmuramoyl-L-alanine amidase [Firmicutes bacterium]|nr:N-acetylmuramoyl-L-alanine amidase [Bacillota bacterium]